MFHPILVLTGLVVYTAGLAFPNYHRVAALRRIRQRTPKPANSSVGAPAPDEERLRFPALLLVWGLTMAAAGQRLGFVHPFPDWAFLPSKDGTVAIAAALLALVLLVLGTCISFAAGSALGEDFLFPDEPVREEWRLCQTGIYASIRHPFYAFIIVGLWAMPLLLWCWPLWIVAPFLTWMHHRVAVREEELMERHFGSEFRAYRSRTARFFGLPRRRDSSPSTSASPRAR